MRKSLSVVVPVFNEEECIEVFYNELVSSLSAYSKWELIFVDDGSYDRSWTILKKIASKDRRVKVIRLTRNFGHQIAVMAGLEKASCTAIAIIDADLQDPPSLLPDMHKLICDEVDIVYGRRIVREGESAFKKLSAKAFYRAFRKLVPFDVPLDTGDFRVVSRRVRDHVVSMNEQDPFLRGLFALTGFGSIPFDYVRNPRFAGNSKYTLRRMLSLASSAVITFSDFPFRIFTKLSLFLLSVASIAGIWAICLAITGEAISGWLSIFALVLFLGSLNIVFSAIIGSYVLQALKASRGRPRYFVSQELN
jgi:polyisoprenyl-phosphate glycosyltransferase